MAKLVSQALDQITRKDSDMEPAPDMITKTCEGCSGSFQVEKGMFEKHVRRCPACIEKGDAEILEKEKARKIKEFDDGWKKICPASFQETDPEKLPCQQGYKAVMQWQPGSRGLILNGPTGRGKSRVAWLLLRRLYYDRVKFIALNSLAGLNYAAKFSRSPEMVEEWVDELISVPILFMDDVFKIKLTESFESVLFSIVDQRTESKKPIIITSNDTGESLSARMTNDRGGPLVRRLREFCDSVTFD